jgi:NAD(P)-dependent dehydrogenase (short-subunit alcohol dehydrogenase family)
MSFKIAVVTGSSSGIGLLTTVELAKAGFHVVATMRDPSRRTRLDEEILASGYPGLKSRIEVRRLDVTEVDSLPGIVGDIVRDHGHIDVLVNNAGFAVAGFAEDMHMEELRMQLETNFFGHIAMTKAALPVMREQQSGHIIMVASILGRMGRPVLSSYSASKFALEGWTEAVRIEMASVGVRLVLVEPGAFKTDIWKRNVHVCKGAYSRESPNRARFRRYATTVRKGEAKGDAIDVAKLIVRIAQTRNPRLRYRIGNDANFGHWMKTLLPWKMWERMVENSLQIGSMPNGTHRAK